MPGVSKNDRLYERKTLEDTVPLWAGKPFLLDHEYKDVKGRAVGLITEASYGIDKTRSGEMKEGLWLGGIGMVEPGMYERMTGKDNKYPPIIRSVSIGGDGDAEPHVSATGQRVNKIKKLYPEELSVVSIPGIPEAHVVSVNKIVESYNKGEMVMEATEPKEVTINISSLRKDLGLSPSPMRIDPNSGSYNRSQEKAAALYKELDAPKKEPKVPSETMGTGTAGVALPVNTKSRGHLDPEPGECNCGGESPALIAAKEAPSTALQGEKGRVMPTSPDAMKMIPGGTSGTTPVHYPPRASDEPGPTLPTPRPMAPDLEYKGFGSESGLTVRVYKEHKPRPVVDTKESYIYYNPFTSSRETIKAPSTHCIPRVKEQVLAADPQAGGGMPAMQSAPKPDTEEDLITAEEEDALDEVFSVSDEDFPAYEASLLGEILRPESMYSYEAKGGWVKKAFSKNKGALRKALGASGNKPIPVSKLKAAAKSKDPKMRRRANLALTAKKFKK